MMVIEPWFTVALSESWWGGGGGGGVAEGAIRVLLVKGWRVQIEPGMIMRVHIKAINATT